MMPLTYRGHNESIRNMSAAFFILTRIWAIGLVNGLTNSTSLILLTVR